MYRSVLQTNLTLNRNVYKEKGGAYCMYRKQESFGRETCGKETTWKT